MLQELHISNYALIEELHINYHQGFNIITGETGAGKSIILGALGLIMGQRADLSVLRHADQKCTVEAIFDVQSLQLEELFEENELDYEAQAIIRREITANGKSRAFINDTPVTLKVLQEVASRLIDIHSQHQNLSLSDNSFQLNLVDLVAGNASLLTIYADKYKNYQRQSRALQDLIARAEQSKGDLDYVQFQFNQLADAQLQAEEQEELEQEQSTLEHAEDIKSTFGGFAEDMEQDEFGLLARLKGHLAQFHKMAEVVPASKELAARLESCYLELKDINDECNALAEGVEYNPERVNAIAERLDLIYSLQQKFKVDSVADLMVRRDEFEKQLSDISSFDEDIEALQAQVQDSLAELHDLAEQISTKRLMAAPSIEENIESVLHRLGMLNASFKLRFAKLETIGNTGIDALQFTFAGNKSSELQDVAKVASGGEISRVMLAVKSLIAQNKCLPTIVFDEIDTGISGEVAVKMGDILKELSANVQILNITHLPQIAGKGTHHFKVYKYDEGDHTFTSIRELTAEERVNELALMLAGDSASETARNAARELMDDVN
ncbi:MAG: DNA repair protein RecN [Mangrovibacterium sp.]